MNTTEHPLNLAHMPTDSVQRWEWIKYQLRIRGCAPAELARQLAVTDRAIRAVKHAPYPRIERAIANRLGVMPMQLWPERWDVNGTPVRQRPNRAESLTAYHYTGTTKNTRYVPVPHRITEARA